MSTAKSRHGVSLIELVVAVAIVGVLLALLLPAVSKVRSVARQAASVNNLRQINIATQTLFAQHSDKVKDLPDASRRQYKISTDQTIFYQLLPILLPARPENPESKTFESLQQWVDPHVPMYVDAADPSFIMMQSQNFLNITGICSYAANQSAFDKALVYPISLQDGTSNTIAYGIHYYNTRLNHEILNYRSMFAAQPDEKDGSSTRRATFADVGWYDVVPVVENGVARPSKPGYTFQYMPTVEEAWGKVLQTPHPGGLPVGMFDGSVRTLRPGIAEGVYWALVTPNGGEVIPGDF